MFSSKATKKQKFETFLSSCLPVILNYDTSGEVAKNTTKDKERVLVQYIISYESKFQKVHVQSLKRESDNI